MKVSKKILLLGVGASLMFSSFDANAEINCRRDPGRCEKQIVGLIKALKAERAKNGKSLPTRASSRDRDMDKAAVTTVSPELEKELKSLNQRIKNTQEVLEAEGLPKGLKTVRKYTARIKDRATAASRKAENGSALKKELTSAATRADNILKELNKLKKRSVSRSEAEAVQATVEKYLSRMAARAGSVSGSKASSPKRGGMKTRAGSAGAGYYDTDTGADYDQDISGFFEENFEFDDDM